MYVQPKSYLWITNSVRSCKRFLAETSGTNRDGNAADTNAERRNTWSKMRMPDVIFIMSTSIIIIIMIMIIIIINIMINITIIMIIKKD